MDEIRAVGGQIVDRLSSSSDKKSARAGAGAGTKNVQESAAVVAGTAAAGFACNNSNAICGRFFKRLVSFTRRAWPRMPSTKLESASAFWEGSQGGMLPSARASRMADS